MLAAIATTAAIPLSGFGAHYQDEAAVVAAPGLKALEQAGLPRKDIEHSVTDQLIAGIQDAWPNSQADPQIDFHWKRRPVIAVHINEQFSTADGGPEPDIESLVQAAMKSELKGQQERLRVRAESLELGLQQLKLDAERQESRWREEIERIKAYGSKKKGPEFRARGERRIQALEGRIQSISERLEIQTQMHDERAAPVHGKIRAIETALSSKPLAITASAQSNQTE